VETTTAIVTHYGTGGSLFYAQRCAIAFEKKGYQVLFYLPPDTDLGIKDRSLCRYILKEPSTPCPFFKVKLFKYLHHLSKYLYNAFVIRPEEHIKVVHLLFPFYLTDWITTDRLKKRGLKVVLTVHEIIPHRFFLGGSVDLKLLSKLYGDADLLLVHTESLKEDLSCRLRIDPEKIKVIPHGFFNLPQSPLSVVVLKNKYHIPLGKKVLLFFGTIRENKGLDILLSTMQDLKEDYFLLIAGNTAGLSETPVDYYKRIIEVNKIRDTVNWVDRYISDEEASEVFKTADAVILPYKKSFHAQSGVLNLAIGYEKPCVVADVGGMGETVAKFDLGIVVQPEDPRALTSGIVSLFKKNNYRYGFRRYKEAMSWDKIVGKLIDEYILISDI